MQTLLVMTCTTPLVYSQPISTDSLGAYFRFEDSPPLSCLFEYIPPFFIQHGIELKEFIRSRTFRTIRERFGDVRGVDAIFVRAMRMTNNNTAMALLMSTIACFDHSVVGIKVPVLSIYLPLTSEPENEFERRVRQLPSRLYPDTPDNTAGDRDKLQHFLGSAFLAFVFESGDAAMNFGEFVEQEEEAFIVGGINDNRDLRADRQGQRFGIALLDDNHRLPSEFLKPRPAAHTMAPDIRRPAEVNDVPLCSGAW